MASRDPILQPFQLKTLRIKNRIVSTPHAPAYAEDGKPKLRYQLYHEEKAKGGIGMTMFGGSSFVSPDSPAVFGQIDVSNDGVIPYFQEFSERIHQHDCGLVCQISHLGRRTTWNVADWLPVVAPSRVRETAHRGFPKEIDQHDIKRIIRDYAAAALRCKDGGLDGCEILNHGHLPEQFLSPFTNRRTDQYGGSLNNRLRFTFELLEAVRAAVGPDFIVGLRQGLWETFDGGLTKDEGLAAAEKIVAEGLIDYMTVNFGHIDTDRGVAHHIPGMWAPLAPWLEEIRAFRAAVNIPTIHACRIADLSTARHAVESGILDMAAMVRAHIADPYIVKKLEAGQEDQIRPCVGANYCLDRIYLGQDMLCMHNAASGREGAMPHIIPRSQGPARKIVVVGGGPGGMEAARVCAERGHSVVLFEATDRLGGQLNIAAMAGWRRDLASVTGWLSLQLERLNVMIRWNTLAGSDEVRAENPDVVIIATGGLPDTDIVPGSDLCISVWDALCDPGLRGSVLVYDDSGQAAGASCADALSGKDGATVELLTPDRMAALEMGSQNYPIFLEHFYQKGVTITPDHRIQSVQRSGNRLKVTFTNEYGGPPIERVVDHLVVEHGTVPLDDLFIALRSQSMNDGVTDYDALLAGRPQPIGMGAGSFALYRIGDAVASRNVHAAIYDALRLSKDL
jgi:2,4-dienoyl-CoA reductase-like NADH-dependent reductase (Old Yellow Enzyme family)